MSLNNKNIGRMILIGVTTLVSLASAGVSSASAGQGEAPAASSPGSWNVSLGVGLGSTSSYPGGRDRYVLPFPAIEVAWNRSTLAFSASVLNGVGVTVAQPATGLIWNASVNAGRRRTRDGYTILGVHRDHSPEARARLATAPDVTNPVAIEAMVALPTSVGLFAAKAGYAPTKVTPVGADGAVKHTGLYSLVYLAGLPVTDRLRVTGTAQVKFATGSHVNAWYGVTPGTPASADFTPRGGLHNTQVALQLDYRLHPKVGVSILGASTWLHGDARRSPLTQVNRSHDLVFQFLYRL